MDNSHGPNTASLTASIQILDNDSLFHRILSLSCIFSGEGDDDYESLYGEKEEWARRRWWYKLDLICQRWRSLTCVCILPGYSIRLVCTPGMPVAVMLTSPSTCAYYRPHMP